MVTGSMDMAGMQRFVTYIYEYENRHFSKNTNKLIKTVFSVILCVTVSLIACFLGIRLFY